MKEDAVVGVTSNPTIFQKAISQGDAYDEQLKELLEEETDPKEIFLQLSARDVEAALDLFAKVHEKNPQDGYVSWEVDPTLAYDREGTFDEAMRLHEWIPKPNLYVKIPATKPGPRRDRGLRRARQEHQRDADLLAAALPGGRRGVPARARAARRRGRRSEGALGRELLRLARRHRGRQAPRGDRLEGCARAARQARDREREARVRALPAGVLRSALGVPRRQGREPAALPLGLDVDEEPGVPRRHVRRGADRARTP